MPTFDNKCTNPECEGLLLDHYTHSHKDPTPACPKCGGAMERFYSLGNGHSGTNGYPYVTRNITPDGSPVEVRSPGHEADLCKRYGLRKRDDVGFVEERWEGWDFAKKEHRFSGGGGRGLPGAWW